MKKNQLIFSALNILIIILPIIAYSRQLAQNYNLHRKSVFTENKGQVADQNGEIRKDVKFLYSAPGLKMALKSNSFAYEVFTVEKENAFSEATGLLVPLPFQEILRKPENLIIKTHRIDVSFLGANPFPEIIAEEKSNDYDNYYLSHTSDEGITKVYSYHKLTYKNLYPNIDIVFYAKQEGKLKYDIVVHPGGKLEDVIMQYDGTNGLYLADGKLSLITSQGEVEENIPYSYLKENKQEVSVKYICRNKQVGFNCRYDKSKTLIIDPQIEWGTFYGGEGIEYGRGIDVDDSGNVYIAGSTTSASLISSTGAYQLFYGGNTDAFMVKLNSKGERQWSTYFGGTGNDHSSDILADKSSNRQRIYGNIKSSCGCTTIAVRF